MRPTFDARDAAIRDVRAANFHKHPGPRPGDIVGAEGRLQTHKSAPCIWRGTDNRKSRPWVRYGWLYHSSSHVNDKGCLSEGRSVTGLRIFVRVMPPDVEGELAALDAQIEESKAVFQRLLQERQELLSAAAVRGARVRVKAAVPLASLVDESGAGE